MSNAYGRLSLGALMLVVSVATAAAQAPAAAAGANRQAMVQVASPLSLEVLPSFDLPVGDTGKYFTYGGGLDLGMKYRLPGSLITLIGGLEYAYAPVRAATSLSLISPRVGVGIQLPLAPTVCAYGFAAGGYYFATYNDFSKNASDPYAAAGLGVRFSLASTFSIEVGGQYKNYLGLYQGASATAGVDVALGNLGGSVDVPTLELRPAFPVFYKHYDDHPIGSIAVKSSLKVPATDVRAQVFVWEFMDAPKSVAICDRLAPGESRTADLYALFTDKVLAVTEGTKVAAEITVSYKVEGQSYENHRVETLSVLGRNAMTWDDNAKAAAFVTAKEPQVLNFARSVTSYVRAKENRAICDNLQAAIALHEALDLYGMNYTPNPVTPYSEASRQKDVIDFLQFPRETFQYKAGDCSDLSILYGALLQAVGIDAAFITVPGHIFVAVDSCVPADKAGDSLLPAGQFIPYKGHAWIPVEITMRHQGFMRAWELGAKEWNESTAASQAGFYPVQEAWASYQPVGLPGVEATINVPQSDKILAAYLQEVQKYVDKELAPQIAALQDQIKSTRSLPAMNTLGVLYAKYGQMDRAETVFKGVLATRPYLPALLNLGNLYFLKENWKDALSCYSQANEIVPNNPHVLLGLAKVNQELQNFADLKKNYDKLKAIDPTLASQYAYLGEGKESGARAADVATERKAVIWENAE